jgi:hypothetical protein
VRWKPTSHLSLASLPAPSEGFHFAATIEPWPHSYEIEGTPLENRGACLKASKARVPLAHLEEAQRRGMRPRVQSRPEASRFHEFSRPLAASPFLLIANPTMAGFPTFVGAREADHLQIDAKNARRDRHEILNEALRRVARHRRRSRPRHCPRTRATPTDSPARKGCTGASYVAPAIRSFDYSVASTLAQTLKGTMQ